MRVKSSSSVGSDRLVFIFLNKRAEEYTERVGRFVRFVDALVFRNRIGALCSGDFRTETRDHVLAEKLATSFEQKLSRCHVMGHRESLCLDRDTSHFCKAFVELRAVLRNKVSDGLGIVAVQTQNKSCAQLVAVQSTKGLAFLKIFRERFAVKIGSIVGQRELDPRERLRRISHVAAELNQSPLSAPRMKQVAPR